MENIYYIVIISLVLLLLITFNCIHSKLDILLHVTIKYNGSNMLYK